MPSPAHVWTCSANLLPVLAERILQGFPVEADAGRWPLESWTVLVPTRRAARMLEARLFALCGKQGLVLPRIQPIGDTDEDILQDLLPEDGLPEALSAESQLFLLLNLIDQWADEYPQLPLAQDIKSSPSQALGLAKSLSQLFTELETEEAGLEALSGFPGLDLAAHREAISSLLALVQDRLPQHLEAAGRISAARRRNALIRLNAQRIANDTEGGPVIAAGSTGTLQATRALLKAVAQHPRGAVVLPGLDLALDEDSWNAAGPGHPQFTLKVLLADLGIARSEVQRLGSEDANRSLLVREAMRPASTTDHWHEQLKGTFQRDDGLTLIEAPDRHLEARAIAVMFRELLETPGATGALVTPDRDLAQRVTAELQRWQIFIDDSAGQPLAEAGRGQLLALLLALIVDGFAPSSLIALLAHPLCTLGRSSAEHRQRAQQFEAVCLRQDLPLRQPQDYAADFDRIRKRLATDRHAHRLIRALDAADWDSLAGFVQQLGEILSPLAAVTITSFDTHLRQVLTALDALAPRDGDNTAPALALDDLAERLKDSAAQHPPSTLHRACLSLRWALQLDMLRPAQRRDTRLAIYGLPEARMVEASLIVLGGLNESIWPAVADPGPWVNRSMRAELKLKMPERDIGITAHDFAQGLMHTRVAVTWSKRVASEPKVPSRWVLRLRAVLQLLGIPEAQQLERWPLHLARLIDAASGFTPLQPPAAKPPLALRPTRFSVTEISRLQRDPYAIYARRVLELNPLPPVGAGADARLRGNLFHEAIGLWLSGSDASEMALVAAGEQVFAAYMTEPEVRHFWWPRFKRMAQALTEVETALVPAALARRLEINGRMPLMVSSTEHVLTARADRIDVLADGTLRIIDYKTGQPPTPKQVESGLEPQLTLEAAIAAQGGFEGLAPAETSRLSYLKVSGLTPAAEIKEPADPDAIATLVSEHVAGLMKLLADYQQAETAYRPRVAPFSERESSDYDHLSRFREWSQGGA